MSKKLKKVASIALPIVGTAVAPGIGTALGSSLGSAALSGIGGALGGAAGGAISGGGLSGALKGAALGGAGGYLAGGGLSNLLGSTSLTNPTSLPWQTGGIAPAGATEAAARAATSSAAYGPANLPWLNTAGGGSVAGGGSLSGFLSNPVGAIKDAAGSYLDDTFSAKNLLSSGLKSGLSYAMSDDNSGGYTAMQNAANNAAGLYQPYYDSGTAAQTQIANLSGLNGEGAKAAAMTQFQTDPGYEFARDEGIRSLDASAARRGMLISGNQDREVQNYGTGLANQYFNQYLNRLSGIAGQGQSAANSIGSNQMDAATVYALQKAASANRRNQLIGGLASYL